MLSKNDLKYWYNYFDINTLLQKLAEGQLYEVIEATSTDDLQSLQRINEAFEIIENPNSLGVVVIPINLGQSLNGTYYGFHWASLVIKKIIGVNHAYYNDSFGTPLAKSFPNLVTILNNHAINLDNIHDFQTSQQSNGYDCGPWTIMNLHSLACTEELPKFDHDQINTQIALQRLDLQKLNNISINEGRDKPLDISKAFSTDLVDFNENNKVNFSNISASKQSNISQVYISKKNICFIVNPIIYVPQHKKFEQLDSSDEDYDSEFQEEFLLLEGFIKSRSSTDQNINLHFDRLPFKVNKSIDKVKEGHKLQYTPIAKIITPSDLDDNTIKNQKSQRRSKKQKIEKLEDTKKPINLSQIIEPFLNKICSEGYKDEDEEVLKNNTNVSIGLNRMLSLSTRNNNTVKDELNSTVSTLLEYRAFGFYWIPDWSYNKLKGIDAYLKARKFYKQLKKVCSETAKNFLDYFESNIDIPYQDLREYAKNHDDTKDLIADLRKDDQSKHIYFVLVDGDTIDFKFIFSSYLSIALQHNLPTLMSTGYIFPDNDSLFGNAYHEFTKLDNEIKAITNKHLSLGVYFPEPNSAILIPAQEDTLPESFIDRSIEKAKCESASVLRKLKERKEEITSIYSIEHPALVTTIPDRAKVRTKISSDRNRKSAPFSDPVIDGAPPNENDITTFRNISQSHTHEFKWIDYLYKNRSFNLKSNYGYGKFKNAITSLRKNIESDTDITNSFKYLEEFVDEKIAQKICSCLKELYEFRKNYVINYAEQNLYKFQKEYIGRVDYSRQEYRSYAQSEQFAIIIKSEEYQLLLKQGLLRFKTLMQLLPSVLDNINYNHLLIKAFSDKILDLDTLFSLPKEILNEIVEDIEISNIVIKRKHLLQTIEDEQDDPNLVYKLRKLPDLIEKCLILPAFREIQKLTDEDFYSNTSMEDSDTEVTNLLSSEEQEHIEAVKWIYQDEYDSFSAPSLEDSDSESSDTSNSDGSSSQPHHNELTCTGEI